MPSFFILVPFFLLVFINIPFRNISKYCYFWAPAFLFLVQTCLVAFHPLLFWSVYPDPFGAFFSFGLSVDNLSLIALFCIGLVALISIMVSRATVEDTRKRFYFVNLILISVIGMNTAVLSTDIFSLYVFIEITALASFLLIGIFRDKFGIEAAFKYMILSSMATVFMLSSIGLFILVAGGTSFTAIYGAFTGGTANFLLQLAVVLFVCGLLIKSGVVPFHGWLPDAYTASPAAASILLAGIVTKVCGVYVLLRLFISVFSVYPALKDAIMILGLVSIFTGALAAITQNNLKRMLSYSSISQVGYIILALGCATPLAFCGAVFHFLNHTVFKSLLFVNAAAIEKATGKVDIDKIGSRAVSMRLTGLTSLFGFFSAAGIPPFAGFWSKLVIIIALLASGKVFYAGAAIVASILTVAYFLYLERGLFFRGDDKVEPQALNKVSFDLILPQILLALITIGMGLGFPFIFNTWILPLEGLVR